MKRGDTVSVVRGYPATRAAATREYGLRANGAFIVRRTYWRSGEVWASIEDARTGATHDIPTIFLERDAKR